MLVLDNVSELILISIFASAEKSSFGFILIFCRQKAVPHIVANF